MPITTTVQFDYVQAANAILEGLASERDREIVAQRFSLGRDKRETLETIGSRFGITRERVRQIEKSATGKLTQTAHPKIAEIDQILRSHLGEVGNVALLEEVSVAIGAHTPSERAYIAFLANLAPSIELVEDSDQFHPSIALLPGYSKKRLAQLSSQLTSHLRNHGRPTDMDSLSAKAAPGEHPHTVHQIARATKQIANLDSQWGLVSWPEVNPRSIRDKTYLVLGKHGQPLHFSEIASRISNMGARKRDVTVQAVHNELIKDPRFVLVGRGIYALSEWGYTPGTVADIITEVLGKESPLHRDEIIKRVLKKRQVKTTTIVLNLQEKNQFERVAKATYALKGR